MSIRFQPISRNASVTDALIKRCIDLAMSGSVCEYIAPDPKTAAKIAEQIRSQSQGLLVNVTSDTIQIEPLAS